MVSIFIFAAIADAVGSDLVEVAVNIALHTPANHKRRGANFKTVD